MIHTACRSLDGLRLLGSIQVPFFKKLDEFGHVTYVLNLLATAVEKNLGGVVDVM